MHVCIALCFILVDRRNRWRLTCETRFHLFIPNLGIDIVCFFEVIQMRRRVESFYDKNTAIVCLARSRWATMTAVDFVTSRLFCVILFFSHDCIPFLDWLEWCAESSVVMYGHCQESRSVFNLAEPATRTKVEANVSRFGIGSCRRHFLKSLLFRVLD